MELLIHKYSMSTSLASTIHKFTYFDSYSPLRLYNTLPIHLDLGIETCFYDGMDGYTKIWLQLAFPLYLNDMIIALGLWELCGNNFGNFNGS